MALRSRRWLIAASLMAASAAWTAPTYAQKIGTEAKPFTIAAGRYYQFLSAYRAAEQLTAAGIVTKVIEFPSATERIEAVAAGYAHMSYAGLTASVLLRARGKDVVVVATTNEKGRGLVSKPEVPDVKALKGKKIGVTFGSVEHLSTIAVMRKNGLTPGTDVTLVNMPVPDQPIAFSRGSVDAYMGAEPYAVMGVQQFGGKILSYPYDTELGGIDSGIETSEAFIKERPDLVEALVKKHVEAVKFYQLNPAEVIKAGVQTYKIPEPLMTEALKNVELTYAIKPESIKTLAGFLVELTFLSKDEKDKIDWSKFINSSFVDAAAK